MIRNTFWLALAAAVLISGVACNPQRQETATDTEGGSAGEAGADAAEQLMESVVSMLRGMPARNMYPVVTKQLNQFFDRQGDKIPPLADDVKQTVKTTLGSAELAQLESPQLDIIDVDYLVSSLFFQNVNRSLRSEQYDGLAYAERLFEWLNRNVQVVPAGSLPMGTPLEVCVRGMANAHERTWIFLELLRQADLVGCVVAVSGESEADNPIPWFCGVILENEIYLFHPELGIAIPSEKTRVATLAEVAEHPELLQTLQDQLKTEYELVPPRNKYSLLLALEAPMLSPKLQYLQSRLAGERRTNLHVNHHELFDIAQKAIEEVPGGIGIRVWQRPAQIRNLVYRDPQAQKLFLESLNPVWLQKEESPRMLQLRGAHLAAIEGFVKLDMTFSPEEMNQFLRAMEVDPAKRGRMITQTRQDIVYFGGLSQLGLSEPQPQVAYNWFDRYLNEYASPLLREDDVLAWGELCQRISAEAKSDKPSVPKRLWDLMAQPARETVDRVAANAVPLQQAQNEIRQREALVEGLRKHLSLVVAGAEFGNPAEVEQQIAAEAEKLRQLREQQQEMLSLNAGERKALVQAINDILVREDFYDPSSVPEAIFSKESREELEQRKEKMPRREWIRLNRHFLDHTFSEQIARSLEKWVPGAVLNRGYALHLQGKTEEGLQSIEEMLPQLPKLYQAVLRAQSSRWQAN